MKLQQRVGNATGASAVSIDMIGANMTAVLHTGTTDYTVRVLLIGLCWCVRSKRVSPINVMGSELLLVLYYKRTQ